MCLKEATGLSSEMAVENAVFAENKARSIYFSFRVSGSLESEISSSVENVTCIETVAVWLLLHLPAVAVCCGCPLGCAFERLSHGYKGQGLTPPSVSHSRVATVHRWYCSDHGCIFNVHSYVCGPSSSGFPLCQVPRFLPHIAEVAGWMPSSSPGCGTAGWLPPSSTPLPVPDPQAAGCSREHGLSQTPPLPSSHA